MARSLRETAKQISRTLGILPWIQRTKESLYWKVENWQWPMLRRLGSTLGIPSDDVRRLAAEFDASRLWSSIHDKIRQELAAYPAFWHGTSSEQDLRALYILCRALKPRVVIETGVSSGASAFILLTALQKNEQGELYSIDLSPTVWGAALPDYREKDKINLPPEKSVGWLVPESLKSRWHLIIGDSRKELPQILQHVGACDFFYHDAEHTYEAMAWEYETVWPKISSGGVLTSDDVHWSKAFAEFIRTKSDIRKAHAWRGFGMIRKR